MTIEVALPNNGGVVEFDDDASPEEIRAVVERLAGGPAKFSRPPAETRDPVRNVSNGLSGKLPAPAPARPMLPPDPGDLVPLVARFRLGPYVADDQGEFAAARRSPSPRVVEEPPLPPGCHELIRDNPMIDTRPAPDGAIHPRVLARSQEKGPGTFDTFADYKRRL